MEKERAEALDLADAEARRAIREDLDTTILVEAAAGTGKTASLVDRMVALIREGRSTIDRLSAVTFTVKAAAHLGERFQVKLEELVRKEKDLEKRQRLDRALSRLDACFIGTIHSFCARLLRERPVEAGVDPGFVEMEEPEDLLARREAWERYTQRLFFQESELLARLSRLGISLDDLRETYEKLSENSDVTSAVSPELPMPHFDAERKAVETFLERSRPVMPQTVPRDGWDSLAKHVRQALRLRSVLEPEREPDFIQVLEALKKAKEPRRRTWGTELWNECETLQRELIEPALRRWREYLHPILMGAITPAVGEFALWRRREGRLNFQDLLLLARDLLRANPEVRRAFQERFTPLLVDEFQDTDPIQAEVILYLTGKEITEKNWKKLTPLPGSLFVVGDPKQSIYRFRRADIETYNLVRDRIEESGGKILRLATNFRSAGKICRWVNEVFTQIFLPERSRHQAEHVPLEASLPEGDESCGVFRLEIPTADKTRAEKVADTDAERIASWIEAALDSRLPLPLGEGRGEGGTVATAFSPANFLILLRYRRHMSRYARKLEERGIPYEIAGGGAFRDSKEIAELLTFLQAIADPDNPVPLLAALRGPLFGVDDRALYEFHRAKGRFSFRSQPPKGTDPRILRAFELLREGRQLADELPPGAAIARICARLGWLVHAASQELGKTRAGNLLKALIAARQFSAEGENFAGVARRLAQMTEEGETEEMMTEPGRRDAVRLMTLHRAKGLEARVVFLADPSKEWDYPARFWIDREADPPEGHFLVAKKLRNFEIQELARPLDWEEKASREEAFEEAEKDRLLYVAATRAKEALIVSIQRNQKSKGRVEMVGPWAKFDKALTGKLPEPLLVPAPLPPPPPRDIPQQLAAFQERRRSRLQSAAAPSYSVTQITALAHRLPLPPGEGRGEGAAVAALPFAPHTGRGMSWGRVLHRLLETLMRDASLDLRAYAANLLAEEERPAEELEEAVRLVEAVRASDLWQRALAANRRLVEVPFALTARSAELGLTEGPTETLLQGTIDLLFEEDSGWTLIDYKSDTIKDNFDKLVSFYRPQVAHYRRYWQELTGQPTRAALYFIETRQGVWLQD